MPISTHELTTIEIPSLPSTFAPVDEAVTGAWSIDDLESDDTAQPFETVEHRLKDSKLQQLGRAAYWLTHRKYRHEVRDRANHIVQDVVDDGSTVKQVLPPRTRDYKSIKERRRHTSDLALDILQYIQTIHRIRQLLGAVAFMTADSVQLSRQIHLPAFELPDSHTQVPVSVIEEELPPLDGDPHSDGDYIAKIVVDRED